MALQLLENGRPLEVRRIAPAAEGVPVHTVFQVTPARGSAVVYSVSKCRLLAGELVPENNARSVLVQPPVAAASRPLRRRRPGFEHSFLKRAWAADPGLDIDSIVRKGKDDQGTDTYYIQASQSRSGALSNGYPSRAEDLFAYDAIVLANVEPTQLTREQQELTRSFVGKRGGGLLVLGARTFVKPGLTDTPLEEVLPLQLVDRGDTVLPATSSRGMNHMALTPAGEVASDHAARFNARRHAQAMGLDAGARLDRAARRAASWRERARRYRQAPEASRARWSRCSATGKDDR